MTTYTRTSGPTITWGGILTMVGISSDCEKVMTGAFTLYETHGIPLDLIIDKFNENNMVIDWIDFYERSLKCNWNIKTTIGKIEEALLDTKGRDYTKQVLLHLNYYLYRKHEDD